MQKSSTYLRKPCKSIFNKILFHLNMRLGWNYTVKTVEVCQTDLTEVPESVPDWSVDTNMIPTSDGFLVNREDLALCLSFPEVQIWLRSEPWMKCCDLIFKKVSNRILQTCKLISLKICNEAQHEDETKETQNMETTPRQRRQKLVRTACASFKSQTADQVRIRMLTGSCSTT